MKKGYLIVGGVIIIIITCFTIIFLNFKVEITKTEALEIAYKNINIEEKDIMYQRIENVFSDHYYKILINDSNQKYEIKIDSNTGKILNSEIIDNKVE